jgi:hypothetical protein
LIGNIWQLVLTCHETTLMSFIFKVMLDLYQSVTISGSISNIYWHASKRSSISFSHRQCPSDRELSFPRFVDLLILSLWSCCCPYSRRPQIADHPRYSCVGSSLVAISIALFWKIKLIHYTKAHLQKLLKSRFSISRNLNFMLSYVTVNTF